MRTLSLRHANGFPLPVHDGSIAFWHLADVLVWLQRDNKRVLDPGVLDVAQMLWQVNVASVPGSGHCVTRGVVAAGGADASNASRRTAAFRQRIVTYPVDVGPCIALEMQHTEVRERHMQQGTERTATRCQSDARRKSLRATRATVASPSSGWRSRTPVVTAPHAKSQMASAHAKPF